MHMSLFFSLCVFHFKIYCMQHIIAQTAETVRRHQIINTQGGGVHFRLCSKLWSEGGLGWGGGVVRP